MSTFNKFQQFVEDLGKGVHNLSANSFKLFFTNTAPDAAGDAVLADIAGVITPTNLDSVALVVTSAEQVGGVLKFILQDKTVTATGSFGPFRYVGVYNDTPTSPDDPVIGWYDHGSSISLNNGDTYLTDFDPDGLFTMQ